MSLQFITYNKLNEHSEKIAHFSTTRTGGVSVGKYESFNLGFYTDDNSLAIQHNRNLLCTTLGIHPNQLHNAHQTHGVEVKCIDENFMKLSLPERQKDLHGYDALITNLPHACITVTTADCVPILLYDKRNQAVAAIHSGWRSTVENISEATINLMRKYYTTQASELIAAIGPCISQPNYEVGEDVYNAFHIKGYDCSLYFRSLDNGKYMLDVAAVVRSQLKQSGVCTIEQSAYCTFDEDELFFSARRLGNASGRMLTGIFLKP